MINHNSSKANVALRWVRKDGSQDLTVGPLDGLDVDSEDFASYNTRLQLEYVAIQDISEGDELFLNYGKEWEDALLDHIEHGTSSVDESQYISAQMMSDLSVIAASGEGRGIEDQNYMYECNVYPNARMLKNPEWEEFSSNHNIDKRNWPSEFVAWYRGNEFASWYPCRVVTADAAAKHYDIEVYVKPLTRRVVGRKYRNVPGDRIRVAEGLYRSDQHLPWSFRHYVPIPDSMFPLRWRDDYRTSMSLNLGKPSATKGTPALVEDYERALREAKCGLYLAKSNIPNAGMSSYRPVALSLLDSSLICAGLVQPNLFSTRMRSTYSVFRLRYIYWSRDSCRRYDCWFYLVSGSCRDGKQKNV
jgi:hypothetical protein